MNTWFVVPAALGVATVLQAALNRRIGEEWGLGAAVLMNASVLITFSAVLFGLTRFWPESMPSFLKGTDSPDLRWWFVLPGLFGFLLVLGLPWSIRNIGGSKTFVLLIASQVVAGIFYDHLTKGVPIQMAKILGGILTVVGATLVVGF